ncbi:MAG: helix-turn-helix domain-containing protein [Nitrososphaerales archaeon]
MLRMFLDRLSKDDLQYLLGPPFGLTEYEVRALVCLAGGVSSPREVGKIAGIPRAKTYEVLDSLVAKGLALQSVGKPITYSLKENALKDIILEVEKRSGSLISTLRKLEEVRQVGLRAAVEKDVMRVLNRLGFKEISASEGREYIVTKSPQDFRVMIVFPQEGLLSREVLDKISELRRSHNVRLILVLASGEDAVRLQEAGLHGIRPVEFSEEEFYGRMLSILSELEMLEREFEDRRLKLEARATDVQNTLSECAPLLEEVKMFLERREDVPSEDLKRISDGVKSVQEELFRHDLQIRSLKEISRAVIDDFGSYGATSWADIREIERLVESVSSLEERLRGIRKVIRVLYDEVRERVDRREKLGFAPLSVQPPDAPEDRYIVGQKKLKRILEEFIWSSKGLGGLSVGLLLGDHGSGKTLFLRYFTGRINGGDFGSAAAACNAVLDTFLDTYNSLASVLSSSLVRMGNRAGISLGFERQRTFADVMREFTKFVEDLQDHGVMNVYWFIDEFDRLLRLSSEKRNVFLRELQVFIDGHADSPLTILIALTPAAFEKLKVEYPEIVSRIPRSNVFRIPPLELGDVRELVSRSLAKVGDSERSALLEPGDEALRLLLSMSRGNPREVIQILDKALYRASESGRRLDRGILEGLVREE